MAQDPREHWIRQAVQLGRWFKENCDPCEECGELTCNSVTHKQMHQNLNDRFTAIEKRLAVLESPPPPPI